MSLEVHHGFSAWLEAFTGHEAEFKQRLIQLSPPETHKVSIHHAEPINCLTLGLIERAHRQIGPAQALILDDVLFNPEDTKLTLPFMPEYQYLTKKISLEIEAPHNSALISWEGYGHFLMDQISKTGLYALHPETAGQPLALNLKEGNQKLVELWPADLGPKPLMIEKSGIIRFKRLSFYINEYNTVRRCQANWMQKTFLKTTQKDLINKLKRKVFPSRIYLARHSTRRLINHDKVKCFLESKGFETIKDDQLVGLSISEQAALFHSADVIVSTQGSHLINSFFCHPNVYLIELFKFCWMDLSPVSVLAGSCSRADYGFAIDWQPWETSEQSLRHADIRMDLTKLEQLLKSPL
jgi:Glycosyltransferase 61